MYTTELHLSYAHLHTTAVSTIVQLGLFDVRIEESAVISVMYTVETLLSRHPRGTRKRPLNRGSSEISRIRGINAILFKYNTVEVLWQLLNKIQSGF